MSSIPKLPPGAIRNAGWALLASLLATTFLAAVFSERTDWPGQLAGEATYLMQARSLAEDFDLAYTRADFDRMLLDDLHNPTDLALTSGNGGRRITFDRPFPYALYLAPWLKLWPGHGFAVANALLLALVSVFAALRMQRSLGAWGVVWISVLVFGSVLFAYVFLATGDLFLFAVTVLAFGLVVGGEATAWRWWTAGALLAVPAATEPLYVVLAAAALFVAPRAQSRSDGKRGGVPARYAVAFGFLACFTLLALVGWWTGGGLLGIGASSFRFTPETGYPLVDFTAAEWSQTVRRLAAFHWDGAPRFSWGVDPWLWTWDGVYLLLGRSIGLLPYFAPLLLLPFLGALLPSRRPLALAAIAWAVGVVVLRPFDLYGGDGAVANRLFLPIYGALWWSIAPARKGRLPLAAVASVVLAAPFLWQLWNAPRSYPIDLQKGYRHVAPVAWRLLPYETSQRRMPGGDATEHNDLMVKFLSEKGWAEKRRGRLVIEAGGPVELLIGSSQPLDALRFDFGADAPGELEVEGGELAESILEPGGGISFRVFTPWPRRHPTWWTPQRQWLYRLTLELPEAGDRDLGFQVYGEQFE